MRWWWQKRDSQPDPGETELEEAKKKADQLVRRTARILRENNLGSDIKKALGGGYR